MSDVPATPSSGGVAGPRRAYAIVLLLATAFILYGSLFPFEYRDRSYPGGPLAYLLTTRHDWDSRGDLLSNILLYIPFGFFGAYALPARVPGVVRVLLVGIAGAALATGIETAQFHDFGRVTTMGDVYANAIGAVGSALAAAVTGASMRWPFMHELGAHPSASLLLAMFLGYRLYPYVPTIDLHKYWHAVQPMLQHPTLPGDELLRYAITWLFIGVMVHSLYGFGRFLLLFPLLCGFEFVARIMVIDGSLKLTDLVGGVTAYLLWAGLLRWLPGRFGIVTLAFLGLVIALRLQPFQFGTTSHAFNWLPFRGFMTGSTGVAIQVFCEKFYQYGGLIWLLSRIRVPLPMATGLTALLLFATSYAECWLPGRSAEITDAIMALIIGGVFGLLRNAAHARRGTVEAAPSDSVAAREHARVAQVVLAQHGVAVAVPRRRGRKYAPYVPPHLRG